MNRTEKTQRRQWALSKLAAGDPLNTVAQDAGLSAGYLRILASRNGIKLKRKAHHCAPNLVRARILADLESITCMAEVARRQGVSREYVRQIKMKEVQNHDSNARVSE